MGVSTWHHAFVRVPDGGRDLAQQPGPKDTMHVFLEGTTKSQLSYTLYMMTRKANWTTPDAIRSRAASFPWPQAEKPISRPGYLPAKMFTGTGGTRALGGRRGRARGRGRGRAGERGRARGRGRGPHWTEAQAEAGEPLLAGPHKTMTPPFTAHHMLTFALHSIELLRPFLPPDAMESAWWSSWVSHVHILSMIVQPSFSHADLLRLEDRVMEWYDTLFSVPEFAKFWVPKFHYCCHLASDILRFGPPRLNWCMMYEAKNQPLKRGCKRSNFLNPGKTTATFWCKSSDQYARSAQSGGKRVIAVQPGERRQTGPASAFLADHPAEVGYMLATLPTPAGSAVVLDWLASIVKYRVLVRSGSYVLASLDPALPPALCYVQHLIRMDGTVYMWVVAYPSSVISYDEYGVLQTSSGSLDASSPRYLVLTPHSHAFSALWAFDQPDGSMRFLSKW